MKSIYNVEIVPKILPNTSVKIEGENLNPIDQCLVQQSMIFYLEMGHVDVIVDPTLVDPDPPLTSTLTSQYMSNGKGEEPSEEAKA